VALTPAYKAHNEASDSTHSRSRIVRRSQPHHRLSWSHSLNGEPAGECHQLLSVGRACATGRVDYFANPQPWLGAVCLLPTHGDRLQPDSIAAAAQTSAAARSVWSPFRPGPRGPRPSRRGWWSHTSSPSRRRSASRRACS
jgi:hypothetical protein